MNQKPDYLKTLNHLERIRSKSLEFQQKPYGGGNPYHYCGSCGRSMIEASYKGHEKNCKYEKYEKIQNKLEKRLRKELKSFLKRQDFNKKSFLHYYWNQTTNRNAVYGLNTLIEESIKFIKANNLEASYFKMYVNVA